LLAVLGHDISNQLTIALNYSFLLARSVEDNPELREYVDEMQQAAWRASHLTQLMRIVAPPRSTQPNGVDLHDAIEAAWPLLERIGAPAQLKLDARRACPQVIAVRTDVDQILCALALHARRVLAGGGAWGLSVRPHSDAKGDAVRLSCLLSAPPRAQDESSSGVQPNTPPPRGDLLRAALRRAKARLSRRANTVRVDFPISM
jgi:signal transduction histidine kinase